MYFQKYNPQLCTNFETIQLSVFIFGSGPDFVWEFYFCPMSQSEDIFQYSPGDSQDNNTLVG